MRFAKSGVSHNPVDFVAVTIFDDEGTHVTPPVSQHSLGHRARRTVARY